MDFIERIFGVAPDSGSGVSELMLLLFLVMFTAVLLVSLRNRWTQRIADEHAAVQRRHPVG